MADRMCNVQGCGKTGQLRRGWCDRHYRRWKRNGDPGDASLQAQTGGACSVEGCSGPGPLRRSWCHMHYARWQKTGTTADPEKKIQCSQGHPYDDENTYVDGVGKRHCRACRKVASRKSSARAKPMPPCSIDGCGRVGRGGDHGWCAPHYRRWKRHGDPLAGPPIAVFAATLEEKIERRRESARRFHANHPDREKARYKAYRAANWEKVREGHYKWRAANPDAWYAIVRLGRDRRRAAIGAAVERVDYAALLAEHGMVCHICGGVISNRADLHMDHVIPLARGGDHAASNIRPSHARCNQRKHSKLMSEL